MRDRLLMLLGLVFAVGLPVWQVRVADQRLAESTELLLALAPADPRSLVQGDYMRLDWQVESWSVVHDHPEGVDTIIVVVGEDGIARFDRYDDGGALEPSEHRLRGSLELSGELDLLPNSFFFEEGKADYYADARYGRVALHPDGLAQLVGLANEDLQPIDASQPLPEEEPTP